MRLARLGNSIGLLLFLLLFATPAPAQQTCDASFQYERPADGPRAFGFSFINGYASIDDRDLWPSQFTKKDGTLREHAVTADVASVASFTGSAFRVPAAAVPLMLLGSGHTMVLTQQSGYPFSDSDPRFSAEGLCQGALLEFGKGKVAVFGEAAMFTTQSSSDGTKFGLQAERAPHNIAFLLNLMRWLVD